MSTTTQPDAATPGVTADATAGWRVIGKYGTMQTFVPTGR